MMRRWACFASVLALVFCGFSRQGIAADTAAPTFVYVCRDAGAGGYQAFPDVCRLQDGRLMVVFYAGYAHVSLSCTPWPKGGRICYCTSSDEGHSWTKPEIVYDGPNDDRDPSIIQLKNGRIICNFFSLRQGVGGMGEPFHFLGTSIVTSDDLGKTWSEPRLLYDLYPCSSPIRKLSNGRLLLPLYGPVKNGGYSDGIGYGALGISDDDGKTWSKPVGIDNGGQKLDAETDVIELTDGTLYAVERPVMCFSVSKDRGNTWTASKPIGFAGDCPYLHRTRDGIILLAHRTPGTSLHYSLDECKTWSDNVVVDTVFGAYPSMVDLKDGSVLIVYHDAGDNTSIRAKRFRAMRTGVEWLAP